MRSQGNFLALRLTPQQDLKKSIVDFARTHAIAAGAIVTCVGSLTSAHLRFANQTEASKFTGHFEIVSLVGTISEATAHLHLIVSDKEGKTLAGHLLDGSLVYTTAELVLVDLTGLAFDREPDALTGFNELIIRQKQR